MTDAPLDPVAPLAPEARRRVLTGLVASHRQLFADIDGLTEAQARSASNLPEWTVGHVLTHIARNADSFRGIADAVRRGAIEDQYPGGNEQRGRDIDAGSGRPADELVRDVRSATSALEAAFASLSEDDWASGQGRTVGWGIIPMSFVPLARWREVEIHRIDLGLGATWHDLSADYVAADLPRALILLGRTLGQSDDAQLTRELVATLFGRRSDPIELPPVL